MRFDSVVDSFYVVSHLWGAWAGQTVCPANPRGVSELQRPAIPATMTAFVDVNVVPMDEDRVLPHHTVVIENGRITALGPVGKVLVPAGAVRIDGRGKYLMPGLADLHTHTAGSYTEELRAFLANGVTAVRAVGFSNINNDWRVSGNRADTLGPHVYASGRVKPLSTQFGKLLQLDSVTAYVAAYKAMGYHIFELPPDYMDAVLSPDDRVAFDSIMTVARRLGVPIAAHSHGATLASLVALGAGGAVEHMYGLWRGMAGQSAAEMRARAEAIQRAGSWVILTLDCHERQQRVERPELLQQYVKILQEAKVRLLLGADVEAGSPSLVHGELAALVRAGLTPYQALLTGTRNVAQYMRTLSEQGTVGIGKQADLVLLSGNPLADIRYTREPAGVMVNGRWFDRATLDHLLFESVAGPSWFFSEMQGGMRRAALTEEQETTLKRHYETFEALVRSQAAMSGVSKSTNVAQDVLRNLVAELVAMRTILTPEQRVVFDPAVRTWLREQARQGYEITVPGISPEP